MPHHFTIEQPDLKRFLTKFEMLDGDRCWLWKACVYRDGYGMFTVNRSVLRAHRYAWTFFVGAIPDALHVLHRCDVRRCVNPGHLFLGTDADNTRDKRSKGRGVPGSTTIMTLDRAIEIRARYVRGSVTQAQLARIYRLAPATISEIIRNDAWIE
jgi:hypothetical protein